MHSFFHVKIPTSLSLCPWQSCSSLEHLCGFAHRREQPDQVHVHPLFPLFLSSHRGKFNKNLSGSKPLPAPDFCPEKSRLSSIKIPLPFSLVHQSQQTGSTWEGDHTTAACNRSLSIILVSALCKNLVVPILEGCKSSKFAS